MAITCELTTSGKIMWWGYYGYYITRKESKEIEQNLSYTTIKNVFDDMWQSHDGNSSCDWAKDFYGKIIELT
ncbi:unnamed protein product [Meloidogyne enterolobii]|uniref:Uncharacterized protein n=1 Tax=Meloidogyne enterolobii TaxID=390850 RepID=A0ACB1AIJ1_MELEN